MSAQSAAGSVIPGRRPVTAKPTWRDRGACLNRRESWWDAEGTSPIALENIGRARKECRGCPVLVQCLDSTMRAEGSSADRYLTRAALTGPERADLDRETKELGPYDAEEARLLALEAEVSGRPVEEIAAREGADAATTRLALRVLGLEPEPWTRIAGLRLAEERGADIARLVDEGAVTGEAVAEQLGVERRVAVVALKHLGLLRGMRPRPAVRQVLDRADELRRLKTGGMSLRQAAEVMGLTYESVRQAWLELKHAAGVAS